MKKTVRVLVLLVAATFISANAFAQLPISLGVKAGANLSNVSYDDETDFDTKAKAGFQVGLDVKANIPLTGIFIQSGLALTTKGYKIDESEYDEYEDVTYKFEQKSNAMFLQVPIMAGYNISVPGIGVNLAAGPYFAYGIGGKTKVKYVDPIDPEYSFNQKESTFDEDKGGIKKFDMGLTGAVGVEISKFYVNLGYEFGLTNLAGKEWESGDKLKNRNAYLTIGYKIF
ncbi:PorT family protein [Dysgonomonas sp. 216]|uniref:porin family protein n=1 Tax=Dysgonomonas sp. 216 TaxID=2302934 RepID=UPI0013D4174B|nr:porin family protein [Dysgonomonas sp. 216]NDW19725.1 PorT family protein [Dysgonomonas sp. 216]